MDLGSRVKWPQVLLGTLALGLVIAGMWRAVSLEIADPRGPAYYDVIAVEDPDYRYIFQYAAEVERFRDTFKWWTERWINFTIHWRPLSSQVFWLQYRLIGPDHLERWIWVNVVSHIAVLVLLPLLMREVTGETWHGVLAAVLFSGWRFSAPRTFPLWSGGTPANTALNLPKDQPEMLLTACVLLGMVLVLRRRWLGALLAVAAAVCFKESGWMGFPLLLVAMVMRDGWAGLRRIPWWAWASAAVIAAGLLALRWVSLPGHFGGGMATANVGWFKRGLHSAQGPWLMAMLPPLTGAGVLATALLALVLVRDRIGAIWLAVLVGAAVLVASAVNALIHSEPLASGLFMLMDHRMQVSYVTSAFVWAAFAWALVIDRELRLPGVWAVVAIAIATVPWMSVTQAGYHTLYMQYVFQAMLVAWAWVAAGRALRRAALARPSARTEPAA